MHVRIAELQDQKVEFPPTIQTHLEIYINP